MTPNYSTQLALVNELLAQRKERTNNRGRKSRALVQAEALLATLNPFELSDEAVLFETV